MILILCGILSLCVSGHCDYLNDTTTGCSSHCSVTNDEDLSCFNKTLQYFERTLFGIMRNYIASQLNFVSRTPNSVPPTEQQLVSTTLDVMNTVEPDATEDEKGLFSADDAKPIVEALVHNVMAETFTMHNYVCPQGCEKSNTSWFWYFIGSAAANLLLAVFGIFGVMHSHRRVKKMLKHVQLGLPNAAKVLKQY
ncbi:unnamed protein product [Haemonchus placei]|uniref:Transmembrane protein n=1 Tax=Haemonchus placei TaxID=6290 RepID=A0A0N4W0P2_HAEPC|nr:unnamed protein product [Haemonchus placei]